MNKQEIFNKVATHLFEQGVRSVAEDDRCLYRGPNGTKCAVGCLIEDEDYDESMEGKDVSSIDLPENLIGKGTLLCNLQVTHDNSRVWRSTENMKNGLKSVARFYSLDDSILDTLSFKDR